MDTGDIREAYDRQLRQRPFQGGLNYRFEWDRGCFRFTGPGAGVEENGVLFAALPDKAADDAADDAVDDAVDRAIAAQIDHFRRLGHAFEWKLHDYDRPADLRARLSANGLEAETTETVMVFDLRSGRAERPPAAPGGVAIAEIVDEAGFAGLEALMVAVYGDERHAAWLAADLRRERAETPHHLRLWSARAAGEMIAAGWLRLHEGTDFASLWGGATLAEWRGRGIYGHLVALRLDAARQAGCAHVTVDCSADSLPILERRGFRPLATVTPMIWKP